MRHLGIGPNMLAKRLGPTVNYTVFCLSFERDLLNCGLGSWAGLCTRPMCEAVGTG